MRKKLSTTVCITPYDCFYCSLPSATMREHYGIRIALCDSCNRYVLRVSKARVAS